MTPEERAEIAIRDRAREVARKSCRHPSTYFDRMIFKCSDSCDERMHEVCRDCGETICEPRPQDRRREMRQFDIQKEMEKSLEECIAVIEAADALAEAANKIFGCESADDIELEQFKAALAAYEAVRGLK